MRSRIFDRFDKDGDKTLDKIEQPEVQKYLDSMLRGFRRR
jgi:hypothetical protein